ALYSQRDTLNANPEEHMKAYRTDITAAEQYTKKHTGAGHMFSGNDKKGKARVEASKLLSETLKERLANLEATYAQLPAYGTTETPFERFDDMDQLAPGISKGYIPRSPEKINKYLNATIEGAQKQLRTVLDGDAPADEQAFQRKKNAASEHITTIAAANALREWVTAGKTVRDTPGMLHVMKQKMPTRKEFRAVIQGADNWEKLVELGEKACTEDAIGLTAELAKHRSPEEIKNQRGAPAPEKQIEKKHQKGK
ncbi:MAG: hypothetical protein IJV58_08960, partial [Oscillospiraceae bacterium]|nr:hypothetical protein [Oscillospiraceae bacterium]